MTYSYKILHPQNGVHNKFSDLIKIYEKKNDSEIWEAFNQGHEPAFNYIYRNFIPSLFNYGCQITHKENIVQDCIQNIFINLRNKRGSLSKVNCIKAYLFKILHRDILDRLGKEKKIQYLDIENIENSFLIEVSCETKIIEIESKVELKNKLEEAMNSLTTKQRHALILLYEEGLSYSQIAEILEFSEVKTARKLIYRALSNLKKMFHKEEVPKNNVTK